MNWKGLAFVLGCGLLLLWGCAPKKPPMPEEPPVSAEQTWDRFWSRLQGREAGQGFSISASVHLISADRRDRITFQAWGNADLPIRLDLKAGLGTTFSMWRVTDTLWLAYYPRENKAFVHPDSRVGAARLGFASPFDLQELTFIFSDDWPMILPRDHSGSSYDPEFGWRFTFTEGHRVSSVIISPQLDVTRLTASWPTEWTMRLEEHIAQSRHRIPGRVRLETGRDRKAIVHLKEVELRRAWPAEALQLELPDNAERIVLSNAQEGSP